MKEITVELIDRTYFFSECFEDTYGCSGFFEDVCDKYDRSCYDLWFNEDVKDQPRNGNDGKPGNTGRPG